MSCPDRPARGARRFPSRARRLGFLLVVASILACAGQPEDEKADEGDDDDNGACGEWSSYDMEVVAKVEDPSGRPLGDIRVYLDDLATGDGALGEGITGADGETRFSTPGVEFAEDCMGTLFDYRIIAEDPSEAYTEASDDMNSNLYNATLDGSFVADVRNVPLVMDEAE